MFCFHPGINLVPSSNWENIQTNSLFHATSQQTELLFRANKKKNPKKPPNKQISLQQEEKREKYRNQNQKRMLVQLLLTKHGALSPSPSPEFWLKKQTCQDFLSAAIIIFEGIILILLFFYANWPIISVVVGKYRSRCN